MSIPYKILNNGHKIPSIGLGVFKTPQNVASGLVEKALDAGYRLIDSAKYYENERDVCEGIANWIKKDPANTRESVFYTTKITNEDHGYENAKKAIAASLEKAKSIKYIDLILVHSPMSDYKKRHGTWKALQEAYKAGTVKNIGVSNYGIKHIDELLAYPDLEVVPAINQIELNPWLMREELVDYCKAKGIVVEAYSPLTRGMWLDNKELVEVAKKHGKSVPQVLLNWSLSRGYIPLPKTVTESRLAGNLDVFGFKLDADDLKVIEHKDGYGVTWGFWDPSTYPLDDEK